MAIKSALISAVNSFYTIVVTISKVKASLLEIINNFYGTVINETHLVNSITTENPSNPNLQYNVFFCKQGRKVTIKGNLINNSTAIIGGESGHFFEIINPEYLPNSAIQGIGGAPTVCTSVSGNTARFSFFNNKLITNDLGAFEAVFLNIEYLTEN